ALHPRWERVRQRNRYPARDALGNLVQRQVRMFDLYILGLRVVHPVPQLPSPVLAVRCDPNPAEPTRPAACLAGDHHPIPDGYLVYGGAGLLYHPDAFMTQDALELDRGHVAFEEDVQVRAADGGVLDADDGVSGGLDGGFGAGE